MAAHRLGEMCALCGHDPACGFATSEDGARLCHNDDHSCYEDWTVHGIRAVAQGALSDTSRNAREAAAPKRAQWPDSDGTA